MVFYFYWIPLSIHKIWNITNHGYWSWALTFYTLVAKHAFMSLEEIDFACVPWLIRHEHKVVGSRGWHGETAGLAFEVAASGVSAGAALPGIHKHRLSVQPVQVSPAWGGLVLDQHQVKCFVLVRFYFLKPEVKVNFYFIWIIYLLFIDRGSPRTKINSSMLNLLM